MKKNITPLSFVMLNLFQHPILRVKKGMLTCVSMTALTVCMLFATTATAQTNVSGFISANTTWNLAGSPYVVVGNALLSYGYTLTIDPGVVVKFNDSTALQIDGELHAIGTAANRITFTSNQANPAAGDWAKIHFADTSVNATFDVNGNYLSGCIMKYCDVMYGGQLGFGEIHNESSSPYFNHCNIMYSSSSGIYSWGATHRLDSSTVRNCVEYGLVFDVFFANSCSLIIHNDSILSNSGGGINLGSPAANINCSPNYLRSIKYNYFYGNNTMGAINVNSDYGKTIIAENTFENNTSVGGYSIVHFNNGPQQDSIICNRFIGNQSLDPLGAVLSLGGNTICNGVVSNNIFENNNCRVVLIRSGTNNFYFTENYIKNNVSAGTSLCYFNAFSGSTTPPLHIWNNYFIGNIGSSTIFLDGGGANNHNLLDMNNNSFMDLNSQIQFYNNVPYGQVNTYISNNYWGSTSTQHVDSAIYDYFDFANLSVVYYSPILTSPGVIDTTCPTHVIEMINDIDLFNSTSALFPNPFTTHATIKFSRAVHAATLHIYNMYGQLVAESSNINGESFRINAEHFRSGVYVYEVTEKNKKICGGKAVVY